METEFSKSRAIAGYRIDHDSAESAEDFLPTCASLVPSAVMESSRTELAGAHEHKSISQGRSEEDNSSSSAKATKSSR